MKRLIASFKGLTTVKKVGAIAGILVLVTVLGLAGLGKFSGNSAIHRAKQPSRLEKGKEAQKDKALRTGQGSSEGKKDEDLKEQAQSPEAKNLPPSPKGTTPSESAPGSEQAPAQAQSQTTTSEPQIQPAPPQTQTQPAPSEKSPSQTAAPDTSDQPPSTTVGEEDEEPPSTPSEAKFVGSIKTMIYHTADCPLGKKIPSDEQIWFGDSSEALDLEYNPCNECNPPH